MHPDPGAAVGTPFMRLILRDLARVMDFAVIDPAGVNIERKAEQRAAHHRAFYMPARRAATPRRVPLHLTRFARRGRAPDREIKWATLSRHRIDPAFPRIRRRAG